MGLGTAERTPATEDELLAAEEAQMDGPGNYFSQPDELRQEAGEPVGPMPPETPAEPLAPEELQVSGTVQLSMFNLGGKLPTGASISFIGGKTKIASGTAFKKGELLKVSGVVRVTASGQVDTIDKATGTAVSCEHQFKARWVDIEVEPAV